MARMVSLIVAFLLVGSCLAQDRFMPHDDIIKEIFQIKENVLPGVFQSTSTNSTVLNPSTSTWKPVKYKSCGYEMQCVPRFLCKDSVILKDGTGVFEFRTDAVQNNTCGAADVCCNIPGQTTKPIIPVEPVKYKSCGRQRQCVPRFLCKESEIVKDGTGIFEFRIDACGVLDVCCNIPGQTIEPRDERQGCGYQNPDGIGMKLMGDLDNKSQFGEFPWMVAILREEDTSEAINQLYECGGALIAPTVVLTAAHCVYNHTANTLVVRAGEWDTQNTDEILPHQDRHVKEIIIHENFNNGSFFNDVALLVMDTPFVWEEHIRPVCLPKVNANFDYSRCFITGWGKDNSGRDANYQSILRKIDVPVVPRDKCQENLRPTRLGWYFELHESFICAGGEKNKGTCTGHGGSPLVCPIPNVSNRFYHAGIVAWRIGCGEENIPGVYASVSYQRTWLDKQLMAKGINFQHFTP